MTNDIIKTAATPVEEPETVLEVNDLIVHYELEDETVEAVNGISFSIKKGRTLGLVGETGAGKTTTAKSLLNIIPKPPGVIKNGSVSVCGNKMLDLKPHELENIRGKDISMIFQDPMTALNPVFTVGDQIAESIEIHEHLGRRESYKKAQEMLEMVGIPGSRADEYPHQFSGGMKQRVVIAIALACSPKVLVADEPTTALDVTIQAQVLDMIRSLKERLGTAMLLITHDLGVVAEVCDEVAVMYAGRIVEYGTLEEVFDDTKHPYTEGLFDSLPKINTKNTQLKPIPGLMPDPTELPPGCAFAPRCRYATPKCSTDAPAKKYFSDTHYVECDAYRDEDFRIKRSV